MKTKTFGTNKMYAINYLNKIRQNKKITFSILANSFHHGGWIVMYSYN